MAQDTHTHIHTLFQLSVVMTTDNDDFQSVAKALLDFWPVGNGDYEKFVQDILDVSMCGKEPIINRRNENYEKCKLLTDFSIKTSMKIINSILSDELIEAYLPQLKNTLVEIKHNSDKPDTEYYQLFKEFKKQKKLKESKYILLLLLCLSKYVNSDALELTADFLYKVWYLGTFYFNLSESKDTKLILCALFQDVNTVTELKKIGNTEDEFRIVFGYSQFKRETMKNYRIFKNENRLAKQPETNALIHPTPSTRDSIKINPLHNGSGFKKNVSEKESWADLASEEEN